MGGATGGVAAMKVLIVGQRDVPKLLPMVQCIDLMEGALKALARRDIVLPLRERLNQPDDRGLLATMPGYLGSPQALGIKVITVFPGNLDTPYESHQGAVLLFDCRYGLPLAMVDASSVTAIRTAAVSGVATRLLARGDADDLAIVGSGTQARMHLEAMRIVRPVRRVRCWSRNADHARAFAEWAHGQGTSVEVMPSVPQAVAGAAIVCTVTGAREPLLRGEWLSPGVHVNAVGSWAPGYRELDTATIVRSKLFVDYREATMSQADDFRVPKQEGVIGDDHIRGEVGELALQNVPGRCHRDEVTIFKSLGLAIEDLAAAHHIYKEAQAQGVGTWVEFGGERDPEVNSG